MTEPPAEAVVSDISPRRGPHTFGDLIKALVIVLLVELAVIAPVLALELESSPAAQFVIKLLMSAFTLCVCWWFACRKYGLSVVEGFSLRARPFGGLAWGLLAGAGWAAVGGAVMTYFSTGESEMARVFTVDDGEGGVRISYFLMPLSLIAAVAEEFYYRGFVYPVLERVFGAAAAIALLTVWFGLIHAPQLAGDWAGIPVVTGMGFLATWLRYKFRSLIPAIVSHFTYNFALSVLGVFDAFGR